jgi:hypothetical protein
MARKLSMVREKRLRAEGKGIQAAGESMERRGTKGAFGPATKSNIARGMREGGLEAKRANFARMAKRGFRPLGRRSRR